MIRLILVAIVLFGFLILGIPLLLIEWVIGKFNQKWKDYSSLRLVQGAFKLIMFMSSAKKMCQRTKRCSMWATTAAISTW
mgnify:CR=1 FL=1